MCHERWARRRDEAVASSWLRELQARDRDEAQRPRYVSPLAVEEPREETLTAADDREAVVAG